MQEHWLSLWVISKNSWDSAHPPTHRNPPVIRTLWLPNGSCSHDLNLPGRSHAVDSVDLDMRLVPGEKPQTAESSLHVPMPAWPLTGFLRLN